MDKGNKAAKTISEEIKARLEIQDIKQQRQ